MKRCELLGKIPAAKEANVLKFLLVFFAFPLTANLGAQLARTPLLALPKPDSSTQRAAYAGAEMKFFRVPIAPVPDSASVARHRHVTTGLVIGSLVGAVVGATAVSYVGTGCDEISPNNCSYSRVRTIAAGGLVVGLIGAGIGAAIGYALPSGMRP